jgi:hypothetical protein
LVPLPGAVEAQTAKSVRSSQGDDTTLMVVIAAIS